MDSKKWMVFLAVVFISILLLTPGSARSASAEKKFVVAVKMEPTTMDQSLIGGGGDHTVLRNWGEYLIDIETNGNLRPGLATSWTVSPDGKTIDFTLRKGVKFHSGNSLTAKDIQFSMERSKTKGRNGRLAYVTRFEMVDDYRFKIHFSQPDVGFIPYQGGQFAIVSKSYFDRVGEAKAEREPVGTGPYKLVKYVPGEYADIARFEDYWGNKPPVREARFYFVTEDTTRVAKLKAGEVDFITGVPYPLIKDIKNSPGLNITKIEVGHPTPSVAFANQNPKVPWYDKRVRLAMAYAIDCDAIIKNFLLDIPSLSPFLSPGELGYDPNLKNYPYDPKKAKELLAEAGYPNGFELPLYYPTNHRLAMIKQLAEPIASYFEAIGIKTKLIGLEMVPYRAKQTEAQKKPKEGVFVNWGSGGRAGSPEASYFLSQYFTQKGRFSTYSNPELEKIVKEAIGMMDDQKRAELIKKGIRIIHDDVASIPVFNNVIVSAMKDSVTYKPTKIMFDIVYVKDVTMK